MEVEVPVRPAAKPWPPTLDFRSRAIAIEQKRRTASRSLSSRLVALRRIKDTVRHRAPRAASYFVSLRRRLTDASSPYAALNRAHEIRSILGPGTQIRIDAAGVWLHDVDGYSWQHVRGVYGPFLGLEQGKPFESDEIAWALAQVSHDAVVIDVGANIGTFCIRLARTAEPASILAIEPSQRTFGSLCANVERNGVTSCVEPLRLALGADEGEVLLTSDLNAANHVVPSDRAHASAGEEAVRQTTLDSVVREHDLTRLDLLKIDVEGFELSVLRGAQQLLKTLKPAVMMEIEHRWTTRYGYEPQELFGLMSDCGYDYGFFDGGLVPASGDIARDLHRANNFVFTAP